MKYKVKDSVKHQHIGGKEFHLDFEVPIDEVDNKAMQGNKACLNFVLRRNDFLPDFDKKLYYGHIYNKVKLNKGDKPVEGWLGYVLCEDEIEEVEDNYFNRNIIYKLFRRLK